MAELKSDGDVRIIGLVKTFIDLKKENDSFTGKISNYPEIESRLYEEIAKSGNLIFSSINKRCSDLEKENLKLKEEKEVLKRQIKGLLDEKELNDMLFSTFEFINESNSYLCSLISPNYSYFDQIKEEDLKGEAKTQYRKITREILPSNVIIGYMKRLHGGNREGFRNDLAHKRYKINDEKTLINRLYSCADYSADGDSRKALNMKKFLKKLYDFIMKNRGFVFADNQTEELPDIE